MESQASLSVHRTSETRISTFTPYTQSTDSIEYVGNQTFLFTINQTLIQLYDSAKVALIQRHLSCFMY